MRAECSEHQGLKGNRLNKAGDSYIIRFIICRGIIGVRFRKLPSGLRKTTKNHRIAGDLPDFRAGHLPGMSRALPLHQPCS
jgi:hypothetical protein